MYWYIAHVKTGQANKLVSSLNKQENIEAFIPKKSNGIELEIKEHMLSKSYIPIMFLLKVNLIKMSLIKSLKFLEPLKG